MHSIVSIHKGATNSSLVINKRTLAINKVIHMTAKRWNIQQRRTPPLIHMAGIIEISYYGQNYQENLSREGVFHMSTRFERKTQGEALSPGIAKLTTYQHIKGTALHLK
jgi:hypothetical protein